MSAVIYWIHRQQQYWNFRFSKAPKNTGTCHTCIETGFKPVLFIVLSVCYVIAHIFTISFLPLPWNGYLNDQLPSVPRTLTRLCFSSSTYVRVCVNIRCPSHLHHESFFSRGLYWTSECGVPIPLFPHLWSLFRWCPYAGHCSVIPHYRDRESG